MAIRFCCVRCAKVYRAKDDAGGRRFTCKNCGQVLKVPESPASHMQPARAQLLELVTDEPAVSPLQEDVTITHVEPDLPMPPISLPAPESRRRQLVAWAVIVLLVAFVAWGIVAIVQKHNRDAEDRHIVAELTRIHRLDVEFDALMGLDEKQEALAVKQVEHAVKGVRERWLDEAGLELMAANAQRMVDKSKEIQKRMKAITKEMRERITDLHTLYGKDRVRKLLAIHRAEIQKQP